MKKKSFFIPKFAFIFISKHFRTIVFIFIVCFFHHVSAAVSSSLPQVSLVYLGNRNDSTWEIIFKVWLLIKQGIQELWRSFANNDVIVFHAYPSLIVKDLHSSWTPCLIKNDFPGWIISIAQINRGHLRKVGGYSHWNVMKKTIKMKTIVRKLLLIKIIKLRRRNLDN